MSEVAGSRPKVLATVCARGGSQGVPGKNTRLLASRPLIAYTLDCARACDAVDEIVVSTDSEAIARAARAHGVEVPFVRPADMASNESAKIHAIRHATYWVEANRGFRPDIVVDLDVTAPLRAPEDVAACVDYFADHPVDAVVSAYPAEKSPYFNMVERDSDGRAHLVKQAPSGLVRRQDAPPVYAVSGAIFAYRRRVLDTIEHLYAGRWGACVLPRVRAIDIDDEMDFQLVEFLITRKQRAEDA